VQSTLKYCFRKYYIQLKLVHWNLMEWAQNSLWKAIRFWAPMCTIFFNYINLPHLVHHPEIHQVKGYENWFFSIFLCGIIGYFKIIQILCQFNNLQFCEVDQVAMLIHVNECTIKCFNINKHYTPYKTIQDSLK
jgi:hypothetical protein